MQGSAQQASGAGTWQGTCKLPNLTCPRLLAWYHSPLLSNSFTRPCPKNRNNLHEIVYTGRWVLLGVLGAQLLAIVLALIMRCCSRGRTYLAFQEEADYEKRRAAAESQLDKLRSKVLAEEGNTENKNVINISAVSGSAAGTGAAAAAALDQQQQRNRALLFAGDDDGKLDEAEAGKIGSMRTTSSDAQLPMSAWPSASQPPAQQMRSFKATWSKASMPQ